MKAFNLTSNYGHVHFGPLYIGWNSNPYPAASEMDCGDETFGIAISRLYIGYYNGTGWCAGFLNDYGCLD